MSRIINWAFTIPYIPLFFAILVIFHPLQMVALWFGYRAHKSVLDLMNLLLIINFKTVGTRFSINWQYRPALDQPIIFVANHQSMYDIPFMIWILRDYHPKFIAKKELGRWIPSISFALRNMGSVLIDRSDQTGAVSAIENFARTTAATNHAAVIFPEGTRARDGKMRHFKSAGLTSLIQNMPNAEIVPLAINGSWELVRHNLLPVPFGRTVTLTILPPVSRSNKAPKEMVKECETVVRVAILQPSLDSGSYHDLP